MAVAKKAKKDGVEVKIETSNDAQKDKKHSKRKIKTATLETSGLTLSIESVEPEKTSKKAVKAKKVKGEKTPKTAELQAVPEESPVAAAEPVKPTRLRKSAKKVVAKADADDLNTPSPAADVKTKPVRKTRAAKKTEPSEETLPVAEASAAAEGKKAVRVRKVKTVKAQAPAEELSTEQAEAAPVKTPKSKAAKPKAAKSTAKSKGRKKSAKSVDADSEDFDFDDDGEKTSQALLMMRMPTMKTSPNSMRSKTSRRLKMSMKRLTKTVLRMQSLRLLRLSPKRRQKRRAAPRSRALRVTRRSWKP